VSLRRAAVAGSWYPANPEALAREVDRYLAAVDAAPPEETVALVAPHAGLMYSGPIAAHAYRPLRGHAIDVAVIVGPSHYVGFEGVALHDRGAFETPFGPIPVEEECAADLARNCALIKSVPAAHDREHSLEMQLPFLARVLPNISIVPLVMGFQRRATAFALGDALAAVLKGRRAVVIASSDLSHYQNAHTAEELDRQVMAKVSQLSPDGLMSLLEARPEHACGGGPMVSAMRAAQALGASDARVLKYGDSGDVSGDKEAVVGYLAAAFGRFDRA
jgi:AmmeMemoRadiSam system protein B